MATDETAKAILEYEAEDPILLRGLNDPSLIDVPLADLHAMAGLWLARTDRSDELDVLVRKIFEIIDTYYIERQADKIKALIVDHIQNKLLQTTT